MVPARSASAHASVVFLKLPGFPQRPVTEQAEAKSRLGDAIAIALAGVREHERIVLDAPDGAAVVILGNPAAALDFAAIASRGEADFRVQAGVAHGPVRLESAGPEPLVLGDGIAVADSVAALAPAGRIAASRDFRAALFRAAPARARHLERAGTFTDAHDRSHEIFFADAAAFAARRRRFLATGGLAFAGIVSIGVVARLALRGGKGVAAPGAAAPPTPPAAPGTIRFEIRPQGEVIVDGEPRGTSPPLDTLRLPAGRHTIEVRNPRYPPLLTIVDVKPGEELAIKHSFASPQPPKSALRRFLDKFR